MHSKYTLTNVCLIEKFILEIMITQDPAIIHEHYGPEKQKSKHRINTHLIIHCLTSEGVSEVSERASE